MQEAKKIAMLEKREDLIRKKMIPTRNYHSNNTPILPSSKQDVPFHFELFPSPSASYNAFEDNELSSLESNDSLSPQAPLKRHRSSLEYSHPSHPATTEMPIWMRFNHNGSTPIPLMKSPSVTEDLNQGFIEPLDLFQCEFGFDPNENSWMQSNNNFHQLAPNTNQVQVNAVSSCSDTDDDNWLSFLDEDDAISI